MLKFTRGNYSNPAVATDTRYQSRLHPGLLDVRPHSPSSPVCDSSSNRCSATHRATSSVITGRLAWDLSSIRSTIAKPRSTRAVGRFFEKVPLDIAVRELSIETGLTGAFYADPGPGNQPNLAPSNYVPGGNIAFQGAGGLTPIAGGTGAQFQDEITGGVEHEFAHNLTFTGRFVYRDLRRIIEDTSGVNVTQALAGVPQQYVIANPSRALDIYQNVVPLHLGRRIAIPPSATPTLPTAPTTRSVPTAFRTVSRIRAVSTSPWS